MAEAEQSGFTFVDKRRVSAETPAASAETQAEPPLPPVSEFHPSTESEAAHQAGLPQLAVTDRLLMCIDILHQGAWIAMGLVADPATGRVERNLADARLAIDSVAHLVDQLQGRLDEPTLAELRRVVSDLRLNYVHQSGR